MAKLRLFAVYCALLCAVIGLAAGEEQNEQQDDSMVVGATDTVQPVSEEPIKLIHVLNPGEREYLSPNLIGLQNIAMTFIPLTMNFINIVDAYREIVNGVRYDILLNAIDTKDNNNEIICHLVILEKPWLRTQWGDKVREMLSSNCTTDASNESDMDANLNIRNAINDKDSTNTVFNGGSRKELSVDEMAKLESQIMPLALDGKMKYPKIPTTPSSVNSEITSTEDGEEVNKPNDSNEDINVTETTTETFPIKESDNNKDNNDNGNDNDHNNNENSLTSTSTSTTSTTTEKPKELTDDEKNWLDNIFSFGAFNFEQQQLQKQQADNKRNIFESNQLSSSLIRKNEESNYVQPSTDFIMQHNLQHQEQQQQQPHQYQINGFQHQLQLQEQEQLTNFANDFQQIQPLKTEDYQQEWQHQQLPNGDYQEEQQSNDYQQQQQLGNYNQEQQLDDYQQRQQDEENFKINDGNNKEDHMALSQEHFHRSKRNDFVLGGAKSITNEEAKYKLQKSLDQLASGTGPYYKISKIYSATTQIVSGTRTTIDADIIDSEDHVKRCEVQIWSQPWLKESGHEVTFKCPNENAQRVRHSRSVEYEEKKTHKKQDHHKLGKVEHLFNKFMVKFNRRYYSTSEKQMRLRIFKQNLKIIEELNHNEQGSAKYGITEFADLTTNEYKMRTGLWKRDADKPSSGIPAVIPDIDLPEEFDWRQNGAVTHVKNQGNCGSCWAFSVTGNIEGLYFKKSGDLKEFSEQELLDCDTLDSACSGGLPDNAYKAIEDIGGLEYENEYPYLGKKSQCHFNKTLAHIKIKDFADLPKDEDAIAKYLIENGPISIGLNANAMQFYRGGVSHPWKLLCSPSSLDHGVLIVGFGVSKYPSLNKTLPYWIIKNSWGPKWGEQGYYRLYRGTNACGVREMASSAILA